MDWGKQEGAEDKRVPQVQCSAIHRKCVTSTELCDWDVNAVCEHVLRDAQCQQEHRHPALQRTAQLLGPAAQAGRYPSTPEMCVSEPEQVQPQNRGWESFLFCSCLVFVFGSLHLSLSIPGMLTTYPSFWFKAKSAQFFWKADCSFRFRWRFFPAPPPPLTLASLCKQPLVSQLPCSSETLSSRFNISTACSTKGWAKENTTTPGSLTQIKVKTLEQHGEMRPAGKSLEEEVATQNVTSGKDLRGIWESSDLLLVPAYINV